MAKVRITQGFVKNTFIGPNQKRVVERDKLIEKLIAKGYVRVLEELDGDEKDQLGSRSDRESSASSEPEGSTGPAQEDFSTGEDASAEEERQTGTVDSTRTFSTYRTWGA